jgi:hypothetical protein
MTDRIKVDLPGGRLYPHECYLETFTYSDAKAISLIRTTSDIQRLYEIMNQRCSLDLAHVTLGDFWYMMHWQRVQSYPENKLMIPWTCPHCKTKNRSAFDLSKVELRELEEEYEHDQLITLPSGYETTIRLPVMSDELRAKLLLKSKGFSSPTDEQLEMMMTALTFCTIGEESDDLILKKYDELKGLTADDFFLIQDFYSLYDYGIADTVKFTCSNDDCRKESKVRFSFSLVDFFPDHSNKESVRNRVLLRQKQARSNRIARESGSEENPKDQGAA